MKFLTCISFSYLRFLFGTKDFLILTYVHIGESKHKNVSMKSSYLVTNLLVELK
jgi:hypothetical protein